MRDLGESVRLFFASIYGNWIAQRVAMPVAASKRAIDSEGVPHTCASSMGHDVEMSDVVSNLQQPTDTAVD